MSTGPLRLFVSVLVLVLLARAGLGAWRNRHVSFAVWRAIRPRHVIGALLMLAVVGALGMPLLAHVPAASIGLGRLLQTTGNAVFTPLEEAMSHAGPGPATGPNWTLLALSTAFLGFLAFTLPWLAFIEEELFRAGLEHATLVGEIVAALRFGLVHMIMLVPIGAALLIGGVGFVYGRIYRRAYARFGAREQAVPWVLLRAYRPSRRAREAAARTDAGATVDAVQRQAAGVFASTVWHATFNTLIVVSLWLAIVYSEFAA
jgi:hypothetical protein